MVLTVSQLDGVLVGRLFVPAVPVPVPPVPVPGAVPGAVFARVRRSRQTIEVELMGASFNREVRVDEEL